MEYRNITAVENSTYSILFVTETPTKIIDLEGEERYELLSGEIEVEEIFIEGGMALIHFPDGSAAFDVNMHNFVGPYNRYNLG